MTREEAIEELERLLRHWDLIDEGIYDLSEHDKDAVEIALSALRPVSREQIKKMKKEPVEGEYDELYAPTYKCPECGFENIGKGNFCQNCGCLYTDEAVEIVMERLEVLKDGEDCSI